MSNTESSSRFSDLEKMTVREVLEGINAEDQTVPKAVEKAVPAIEEIVKETAARMQNGGRLFYIGAGTAGRLGVVDASECPPTYGVDHGLVIGLIAGGDGAVRKAVEFAEDDTDQAWKDLSQHKINEKDTVIGITASGQTPYVAGGLKDCRENGVFTGCITCNTDSEVAKHADTAIEVITGPEFVTGSTRMKAGTAQKLVLNMISTAVMIQLGRVKGNKMVDMQLSNNKLIDRGTRMLCEELNIDKKEAEQLLKQYGNVREAIIKYQLKNNR